MKPVVVVLALAFGLLVQSVLAGLFVGRAIPVNLVLVAVVYMALAYGPLTGLLAGALGGLVQDALGGGIVGLSGMTKTLIGFLVGVLSAQFNLATTVPRLVMFVAATFVHELVLQGLQTIAEGRPFALKTTAVLLQALVNGLLGAGMFVIVENGPQILANRRMRRASLSKRRY